MTERACRRCGYSFAYDDALYQTRGLQPPAICRSCRADRRARLVEAHGRVTRVGGKFAFVEAEGETFIAFDSKAAKGAAVAFTFDPLERPAPGRRRVARDVRLVEAQQ